MPETFSLTPLCESIHLKLAEASFDIQQSRRLFHGRGQTYPGWESVTIDIFYPAIVITLFDKKAETQLTALIHELKRMLPPVQAFYCQRRFLLKPVFELVAGERIEALYARRDELMFRLQLDQQNIGFFLDIEPARYWLHKHAQSKRVLNLFSYTCVFSVIAMASGAASVLNMDMSSRSLNVGRENHRINDVPLDHVHFFANDIFKSWSRLRRFGPYDVVIIDPPSYQKGSFIAHKDYGKVLRRMTELCADQAQVLVCLNSPEVEYATFKTNVDKQLDGFDFSQRLAPSSDFPDISMAHALKLMVYQKAT